ncbi:23S rRNA (pseudouridine(1915)-N(3))-methyltransferase RlmH [Teredinibacter sp. KSP-S5-2]|uniref:23S rRNA (pseudouridine(1915)-N(3))-methyltransferase RlmH n=1 Tax=Teredinibacter sp. KSP-S5-2 TaxID=3034506 RepID=UPI0029345AB2|nr:23S rRNA (pseudouridine(1915)-N(3))-methyltransferase RlmH [Teredinibacter sp. KSP-S5-2]WNO09504.1 23S rRNA (pseudouridine(1915)-N(3))-methyltransferase RlmH [Teredinibacter sp. KSP-S5-2]
MKLSIVAVGTKMPKWVQQGYEEYAKRLPRELTPHLVELAVANRGKNANIEKLKQQESEQILSSLPRQGRVVALDVLGKKISTEQLAKKMADWQMVGDDVSIVIGGPDGLSRECLNHADEKWSLSDMTLPHPLVRIVLIEQLYRAWSILQNHPYHK